MLKKTLLILLSVVVILTSIIGVSFVNAGATTESDGRTKLKVLLQEINTPVYLYKYYTKETYETYIAVYHNAKELLADENTTEEEFENMVMEFLNAQGNLVLINNTDSKSESYRRLEKILVDNCWDFDYTPHYWYVIYTRESYDAYLTAKQKSEELLYFDENATDEDFKNLIVEFLTARHNKTKINSKESKSESYENLVDLIQDNCFDFDYTPEYWYNIYTKESYDAYLATTLKAEELLADENATDEELEAMAEEFKTARNNLVKAESTEPPKTTVPTESHETTEPKSDEPGKTDSLEQINTLIGDVDFDGNINVKDATIIQLYLANYNTLNEKELIASDVDNNGIVDVKDATYIQLYLANLL